MNKYTGVFLAYLKDRRVAVLIVFISFCIFAAVFSLYSLPMEAIGYAVLLTVLFLLAASTVDFIAYCRRNAFLRELKKSISVSEAKLPQTGSLIEKDYQELIRLLEKARNDIIHEKDRSYHDMVDYYTVWAHEIKTPIAAMRLILQSEENDTGSELQQQLFRVEEYVGMVLQYLRTESMNADLLLKTYSLDGIIKQAVRNYSKIFIRKRIRLNYNDVHKEVLTDEKWLCFVLEQALSNALKYTDKGEISIYMDNSRPDTLVIEDTGIGIEPEDLPRIFEKGFTGYTGRMDNKSTGIGLYLCKKILNKLSHTIMIDSVPGKGTRVMIGFPKADISDE